MKEYLAHWGLLRHGNKLCRNIYLHSFGKSRIYDFVLFGTHSYHWNLQGELGIFTE
jgi:hypothetical protein